MRQRNKASIVRTLHVWHHFGNAVCLESVGLACPHLSDNVCLKICFWEFTFGDVTKGSGTYNRLVARCWLFPRPPSKHRADPTAISVSRKLKLGI